MVKMGFVLFGIFALGILLRLVNLSPFTVYPDSFQSLLVAQNLRTYSSVTGYLGPNGMFYPDFFMWTRPLFPLLINAVSFFGVTSIVAARGIAFVLGMVAIPLAFLFGKKVFSNTNAGFIACLLLALSYNHTIWSGLLMTEAIGVFCMLFFIWQFFFSVAKMTGFLRVQNIFTGVLFAVAVLARYEYMIIALPVIFYALQKSHKPYKYLLVVFGSALIVLVVVGYLTYPLLSVIPVIISQMSDLLIKIGIAVGLLTLCYIAYRFLPKHYKLVLASKFPAAISMLLGVAFVLFVIVLGFNLTYVFGFDVTMFRDFFKHDFLLCFFAFIGILKMFEDNKQHALAYFVLEAIVLLGFIYYHINPEMERYMTHLIPFLLIPASYGFVWVYNEIKRTSGNRAQSTHKKQEVKNFDKQIYVPLIGLFLIMQLLTTAYGLRNLNDPSWYRVSYEEKAALITRKHITGNPILITSSPEPYYYFLNKDTQSIADASPFVYIPSSQDSRTVVLVEDMGMHEDFPHFTKVLDTKLQKYKYATFSLGEVYHYTDHSVPEKYPVELYQLKLSILKHILNAA